MKTRSQALQMEASGSKATTPNVASSSRPPQRKKIKKEANSEEQVAPKRRRRNLSALPTLPLDVLYEIFSHLDPADLLHLSRTTKSFRSVLMSRQSAFVWRAVLDSVSKEDYPACPEDMSEPSWVNLIWGGPWCGLCGSRAQKILWALRRRLCKSCAYERLVRADRYLTSVTLSNGRHICDSLLLDILPSDYARTSSANGRKGEYLFCWDEDVKILNSDVEALQERSSPEEFKSELNKYVSQKKAELQARRTFAAECALLEEKRQDDRQDEIHNLKEERFNQVKARLLDEGYNVADISSSDVRMHNEVWNPKPLTNRVWTRVGPIIREVVEKIRERRITREREDRLAKRKDMVAAEYVSLLRHVAHTSVSFMPSLKTLLQMEPIASAVDLDTEPSEEFIATAEDAIDLSLPLIEEFISMRMECLRKATPDTWITALPSTETGPSHTSSAPKLFDLYRSLATYDLAVYVYRCPGINHTEAEYGRPVFPKVHVSELHFGLDALAHQCTAFEDSPELKTEPYEGGHLLVGRILQLLSLDPATTTALDMDSRQDYFTCDHCQNPYDVFTWRAAIIHWSKHHEADEGLFHVLDPEARAELDLANDLPSDHSARMWGCCHCSAHFGRTHRGIKGIDPLIWFTYTEAKAHATAEHNIASPALVNDIFVNRQAPRTANPSTSYGMLDPWQYIPDFYSLLMQGIDYPPWLDYESDFDDGFSSEYFSDDDLDFMF